MANVFENLLTVPRDVVQRAHDELERLEDCFAPGSETYILYHQLGMILDPDPAFVTPFEKMQSAQ